MSAAVSTLPAPALGPECQNCGAPLPDARKDEAMCDECCTYWCGDDDGDRRAHEAAHGPEVS
jgi:hypothetical protein